MTNTKFALNNFTTDDYAGIFKNSIPLLDVRAPLEFSKGNFFNATNIPILNDNERHLIGIHYKKFGQNAAIELGFSLVDEQKKNERLAQWAQWYQDNPNGVLYCFRGGLRSKFAQDFLYKEYSISIPRVLGGYKALRRYMLDILDNAAEQLDFFLLGGKTGSGKTILLNQLKQTFDLEGAANHLGSAFGNNFSEQPSQVNFEHRLAEYLLNFAHDKLLLEDESRNIGRCQIPLSIFRKFQQAPILVLEVDLQTRIETIFQQYVLEPRAKLIGKFGEPDGIEIFNLQRLQSLAKIRDKLGLQKYTNMRTLLEQALDNLTKNRLAFMHDFIELMLLEYYDPMYEWQLSKKNARVIIKGNMSEITHFWHGKLHR